MAGFKPVVFVCTVIIVWLLLPSVQAAGAAMGDLVPFCTARGPQEHPDIDGNRVVWEDGRDGKYIYYSGTPGSEGQRITSGYAEQKYPSISGDLIVWQDRRHGNWEIYLFSRSGGERRITNSTTDQQMPVVHGDHIIWYDTRRGAVDICLYEIETGQETYLDCSPVTRWKPALSDDYVAWEEKSGGGDIWVYEIGTGEKRQITRDGARQTYPAISGSRIVWEDYRNGEPDIYIFDLDAGREYRITDDPAAQVSPAISGDLLAWEDKRDGVWNIYICDLSQGVEVQMPLAPSEREQVYPAVSADRIVWQNDRDGRSDIYAFTYARGTPPVAEFSVEPAAGTVPFHVSFTDLSSGDPDTWEWDFGDGETLTWQNPLHTYEAPGEYTVSLTVSNRFGSDTITKTALVRATLPTEPPEVLFSAVSQRGPAPLKVLFSGESTGKPTAWLWDFGDGEISTDQNPQHIYAYPGIYNVTLTCSNAAGSATHTEYGYITVLKPLKTDFSADVTAGRKPLSIAFTDLSSGDPNTWEWDFGDGGSSREQNPTHTYKDAGIYTVRLSVTNDIDRNVNEKTGYIRVTAPVPVAAEFSANTTRGRVPLAVRFIDRSEGDPGSWSWDFGDGGTSTGQNPIHVYRKPGRYTVSLTVAGDTGENTTARSGCITVLEPLAADFTANVTRGAAPLAVRFEDASAGEPSSGSWDFGDGNTSTEQNPVHVFERPGTYTVNLTVFGSTDRSTKAMQILVLGPPAAGFEASPINGTAPLRVMFTDTSAGGPTSWLWDFGDGGTSTRQNPIHTYTAAGNYTVNLTAGNTAGSSTAVREGYISVNPAPATPTEAKTPGGSGESSGSARPVPGWTSGPAQGQAFAPEDRFTGITSPDGTARLIIAEGAGDPPAAEVTLEVFDLTDMPPVPDHYHYAGYACIVGPEEARFSLPATLALNLTEEQWSAVSGGQKTLVVQRYNRSAGVWEEVPTAIHLETRSIAAGVPQPGLYALFVRVPPDDVEGAVAAAAGSDPAYAHLIPGFFALGIAAAGVLLYLRREKP